MGGQVCHGVRGPQVQSTWVYLQSGLQRVWPPKTVHCGVLGCWGGPLSQREGPCGVEGFIHMNCFLCTGSMSGQWTGYPPSTSTARVPGVSKNEWEAGGGGGGR